MLGTCREAADAWNRDRRLHRWLAAFLSVPADHPDPVPDQIWAEAARHFDEPALAGLVLAIANQNLWNRLNVATRQMAGAWKPNAAGEWKPDA